VPILFPIFTSREYWLKISYPFNILLKRRLWFKISQISSCRR
jgi:hypothetical protein